MKNIDKSQIYYSPIAQRPAIRIIKDILRLKQGKNDFKYLGLPLIVNRSRTIDFHLILEKLETKLQVRKTKLLSYIGRGTLIKSTAMTMRIYAMQAFLLPKTTCD